jgi:hypothetical protein
MRRRTEKYLCLAGNRSPIPRSSTLQPRLRYPGFPWAFCEVTVTSEDDGLYYEADSISDYAVTSRAVTSE